ncbi:MAG: sensor histidine kinase [bacterium]
MAPNREVSVRARVSPEARHAVLDRALVLQAIEQLVQNGIRFTPDGGSVEVVALGDGPDLRLEVRDTGMGISAEVRPRLFDESFVPRDSRHHHTARGLEFAVPGMGLGLALTRRIAESHGGHVEVESEEGRGSVFTLVLPGALAEAAPPAAADDDPDLAAAA